MIAAPFSAIMIVGAFVLVEVTAGITEASMTRRLSTPCTRSGRRPPPSRAAPSCSCSWRGRPSSRSPGHNPATRRRSGHRGPAALGHHVLRHGGRREQPAQEFEAADHRAAVRVLGEITRVDRRLVVRVGGAGQHIAARQGPHLPRPAGYAGLIVELPDEARLVARRAKTHCTSGVADSSNTLTDAAHKEAL
jgi:hypothetical protein